MKVSYYMTLEQLVGHFPNLPQDRVQSAGSNVKMLAVAAENAGFDAFNVTDHPFPDADWLANSGHNAFDPMAALCFVAGVTSRIRLHTNIVVLPYRNPFITSKEATTLDVLSQGRLILGIGVGYQPTEYEALGVDFKKRGKLMDEAIDAMKLAWKGEAMSFEGLTFHARNNIQLPPPLQKPHPPIWCGGNGEVAIRRAALRCDGWSPFFTPPGATGQRHPDAIVDISDLKVRIEQLSKLREDAGRSGPFDVAPMSPVRFDACTSEFADAYIAAAQELSAVGVTWTGTSAPGEEPGEIADNMAWFGENVLPHVQ